MPRWVLMADDQRLCHACRQWRAWGEPCDCTPICEGCGRQSWEAVEYDDWLCLDCREAAEEEEEQCESI